MSLKKCKSSYPFASRKKAPQKKNSGEKVSKTFDENWADALAASFCFEQKKFACTGQGRCLKFF